MTGDADALAAVAAEAAACTHCAAHLPLGPRPVLRVSPTARLLIVGQAPGTRVHATGIPWNDPSGDRLRDWMGLDRDRFYDVARVAIVPMGFCYPGQDAAGGDKPPRPECAPLWHPRLLALMPAIELTLLVGSYAQAHYLGTARRRSMTETVRAFREHLPRVLALPHPSWRNTAWLKRNPWFGEEVVPELRRRVARLCGGPDHAPIY
ncbi:MAG: uracil-DNA glycosylase family protein [Rhodospirillaceae bacterium]|nr:uracil-DNA glycosylase family protein [Rhodospirillaceae bacterium]